MTKENKIVTGIGLVVVLYTIAWAVQRSYASELVFGFNNPSFSGQGYSTHVLSI